jgi:hypothetical protein
MMIKVSGGFLDFDGDVDVERQVKLFENIDETWGDFSYSFELAKTSNNMRLLGYPMPDNISKQTYQRIEASVLNDSGEILYTGYLRIERVSQVVQVSFFSGNNNWMGLLSGAMIDMDLSKYDQVMTEANIVARMDANDGIVFSLVDTGTLVTRSHPSLKIEDFVGAFYLHTLFKEVFQQSGLKVEGELLNDALFNQIIVVSNTRSKVEFDRNSVYVAANAGQVISGNTVVDFNLITNPYFIGDNITLVGDSLFYANVDMIVDIQASYKTNGSVFSFLNIGPGVIPSNLDFQLGDNNTLHAENVRLLSGQSVWLSLNNAFGSPKTVEAATFKITPKFIYKAFGATSVPNWTKLQFVSNILSAFNVISDFDASTRTVKLNLFNNIKSKPSIDISEYVEVDETDYSTFISDYGKRTLLSYTEPDDEDLRLYNIATFNKYGSGVIEVNNDFIQDSAEIVLLDFASPIGYINPALSMSMEKLGYVEHEEGVEMEITSVTDSSGTPRFNVDETDDEVEDVFNANDLVRIDSSVVSYNGDYVIESVSTSGYIVIRGLTFDEDATGTITKLDPKLTTNDNNYLLVNTRQHPVSYLSNSKSSVWIEGTEYTDLTLGFFSLINIGAGVNLDFKQGLSFGEIEDPLFYQRTLKDKYWGLVERILNDPVKIMPIAHLPNHIFRRISPFNPVSIKTMETTNMYYVNRITGYKESYLPCTIELIKLP